MSKINKQHKQKHINLTDRFITNSNSLLYKIDLLLTILKNYPYEKDN